METELDLASRISCRNCVSASSLINVYGRTHNATWREIGGVENFGLYLLLVQGLLFLFRAKDPFSSAMEQDNGSKCITQNTSITEEMNYIEVQLSKY